MIGSSMGGSSGAPGTSVSSRSQSRSQTSDSPPEGRHYLGGAEAETGANDLWHGDQWATARDEVGIFSADETLARGNEGKLRKVSSEGGSMAARPRGRGVGAGMSGMNGMNATGKNAAMNGHINREISTPSPVLTSTGVSWGGAKVKAGMF